MHKMATGDDEEQTAIISHNARWQMGGTQANPCQHQVNNSSCISASHASPAPDVLIGPRPWRALRAPAWPRVLEQEPASWRGSLGLLVGHLYCDYYCFALRLLL